MSVHVLSFNVKSNYRERCTKMSGTNFKLFLYALWLYGFLPVDHPLNRLNSVKKNRFTIRRGIIAAWSILLLIYPAIFHFDIWINARIIAPAENDRLSTLIPWITGVGSKLFINAVTRLFSFLNYGKLLQLMETVQNLKSQCVGSRREIGRKWKYYYLLWAVYAGRLFGMLYRIVHDLITKEYELKNLNLMFLPQSDILRIIAMDSLNPFILIITPVFLFHLVVALGSHLVQIHGSICAELAELLVQGPCLESMKPKGTDEERIEAENKISRLQDRFSSLKDCFKIYRRLAGTYVFFIEWWLLVVLITVFYSLTSAGFRGVEIINFGVWSLVSIFMVSSFGEYVSNSIEHGREVISNSMGRLKCRKVELNERPELARQHFLTYTCFRSEELYNSGLILNSFFVYYRSISFSGYWNGSGS